MLAVRERPLRGARRRPRRGPCAARAIARRRHSRDADAEARGGTPRRSGYRDTEGPATGRPAAGPAVARASASGPPKPRRHGGRARPSTTANSFAAGGIESFKYVGFEDQFRGSATVIRERLQDYLPLFAAQQDVLDIGCGRGEFLDLLRQQGVRARGLDINHEMVEVCRQRGLDASEGDALGYLRGLADESLGGIFAAQVVEHLEPDYLVRLLQRAGEVLRPGGVLVLETVNVACWFAFFQSYVRDITHVRPLHPDTLAYFVRASGFPHVDVQYRSPYPGCAQAAARSRRRGVALRGQRQRRQAEQPAVHAPRLRGRRQEAVGGLQSRRLRDVSGCSPSTGSSQSTMTNAPCPVDRPGPRGPPCPGPRSAASSLAARRSGGSAAQARNARAEQAGRPCARCGDTPGGSREGRAVQARRDADLRRLVVGHAHGRIGDADRARQAGVVRIDGLLPRSPRGGRRPCSRSCTRSTTRPTRSWTPTRCSRSEARSSARRTAGSG